MKRLRAVVTGRVQGVGYRKYVWNNVRNMSVTGYVKNLPDGSVEVVAEGDEAELDALLKFLYKGPMFARVSDVAQQYTAAKGDFQEFSVQY